MLTGCSDDDDSLITPNSRVDVRFNFNDGYTVYYGSVSASNIYMGDIFTKLPTLTGITFENGVVYYLVSSTSNNKNNATPVEPVKTFTINGKQTITSANSLLSITATGLTDGDEVYFTRFLGNSISVSGSVAWKLP
jgi:hypothetical protein